MTEPLELCLWCGRDTRQSGYVNRIPASRQEDADSPLQEGWMCGICVAETEAELRQGRHEGGNHDHCGGRPCADI